MYHIIPTLQWYTSISEKKRLTPRCPFANIYRCPKYYDSLYLLESTGATSMTDQDVKELNKYWDERKLKFGLREEMPSIAEKNDEFSLLINFCPEVAYLRFGYFASSLSVFADGYDIHERHRYLEREKVDRNDWRWYFQSLTPLHYTECSYYSILLKHPIEPTIDERIKAELTESQEEDYKKHGYNCRSKINIMGKDNYLKKENYVEIDDNGVELSENNYLIFLRLVLEIKRSKEGWVHVERFIQDTNLQLSGHFQLIARLRQNLQKIKIMDEKEVKKFIENKKGGFYRISNHPDFISYDKEQLMQVDEGKIQDIIKQLP
ncbi:MAG: hypothetical protein JW870_20715 [Candidatus Delongbacteria bacterium]|nr:hypothetical protein [Candidatus Delongbacteria bacterium]